LPVDLPVDSVVLQVLSVAKVVKLTLKRKGFNKTTTTGTLYRDELRLCDTLEDCDRWLEVYGKDAKITSKTAIPRGTYDVTINWSNRFKKYMLAVLEVPYFEGVRLHAGNTHENTDGCPLLGDYSDDYTVVNSKVRTQEVFDLVEETLKTEKVSLEVL
jgi:hypothetical protein